MPIFSPRKRAFLYLCATQSLTLRLPYLIYRPLNYVDESVDEPQSNNFKQLLKGASEVV